jgi:hypothetical protein
VTPDLLDVVTAKAMEVTHFHQPDGFDRSDGTPLDVIGYRDELIKERVRSVQIGVDESVQRQHVLLLLMQIGKKISKKKREKTLIGEKDDAQPFRNGHYLTDSVGLYTLRSKDADTVYPPPHQQPQTIPVR